MIYGLKQMEFPLSQISAVSYNSVLFYGNIEISTAGGKKLIGKIIKKDVQKVAQIISELINKSREHAQATTDVTQSDVVSQLERLAALKQRCILSNEEFAQQKAKILGK